jgi:hypothetical protein
MGDPIQHGKGFRQGDPLSPLLFVLAIDPLHHILEKITTQGHLHPLRGDTATLRASLYADDAAVFIKPIKEDIRVFASTLDAFGEVTGLVTNCNKSLVAPIRCAGLDLHDILQHFPAKLTPFPMTYLGLPLSVTRLKTVHFMPLEDKIARKLAPWIGQLMAAPGRTVLVKAVLTAIVIYTATSLVLPAEVMKRIDGLRRAFLWAGCDKVTGGKCKINWERVCRPKIMGGLGVLNLGKFASALRLRWLWFEWATPAKPWLGLGTPCDEDDRNLFAAATTVKVGNGNKACFWKSSWLDGLRPMDIAPSIFKITKRKDCTVREAITDNFWISQIKFTEGITPSHIHEFVTLWEKLNGIILDQHTPDRITWKFTNNGSFSTSSAYKMQFEGRTTTPLLKTVWKIWATPKCKFFAWLIIHNRVWTADRLQRRGWPNCGLCPLCNRVQESTAHLFFQCRFSLAVWNSVKAKIGLLDITTTDWVHMVSVKEWWSKLTLARSPNRKGLASLLMIVSWELWKERNSRVFRNVSAPSTIVVGKIMDEARMWASAGAKGLDVILTRE